jgi:hypothetical protein
MVRDDLSCLLSIRQAGELVVAGRAQLDPLDPEVGQNLQETGKVPLLDHRPVRVGLTSDGQAERVGPYRGGKASGNEASDGGIRPCFPQKLAT